MSFYGLKTYFICIKWSVLHSPNSPNTPNSRNTRQTHLSWVWRVLGKRLGECRRVWQVLGKRFGECRWVWRVLGKRFGECRRVWRVISENGHFGEYSHSPETANSRRVLKFAKFACEWPFLNLNARDCNGGKADCIESCLLIEKCIHLLSLICAALNFFVSSSLSFALLYLFSFVCSLSVTYWLKSSFVFFCVLLSLTTLKLLFVYSALNPFCLSLFFCLSPFVL